MTLSHRGAALTVAASLSVTIILQVIYVAALADVGIDNAVMVEADYSGGYPKQAPYDVILVNGMAESVPKVLTGQLAPGGRLAVVLKDEQGIGRATLLQQTASGLSSRTLFDANAPLLSEFAKKVEFSF